MAFPTQIIIGLLIAAGHSAKAVTLGSPSLKSSAQKCQSRLAVQDKTLSIGQDIRFRDQNQEMQVGNIRRQTVDGKSLIIRTSHGEQSVDKAKIFRAPRSGRVRTPKLDYWWSTTRFKLTPAVVNLLDNAAKITGELERRQARPEVILESVVAYVRSRISYRDDDEYRAPSSFEQVVLGRQGQCLQLSLLTAAILAEAGYELKFVGLDDGYSRPHLWLEVSITNPDGHSIIYVVDPSYDPPVIGALGALMVSGYDKQNFDLRHMHLNPKRHYHELQ